MQTAHHMSANPVYLCRVFIFEPMVSIGVCLLGGGGCFRKEKKVNSCIKLVLCVSGDKSNSDVYKCVCIKVVCCTENLMMHERIHLLIIIYI